MRKISVKTILFFAFIALILGRIGYRMWYGGVFVTDRTARVGTEAMFWQGREYISVSGEYTEGRTVAKSEDGAWCINEVEEDPSHTFVVARSFLDQHLYVSDDYIIPAGGILTTVCWDGRYIRDEAFLDAMTHIQSEKTTLFTYQTEEISSLTENQHMRSVYFAYEGCPVATHFVGYMGKVRGEWVITTDIARDRHNEDGSPKPYSVSCWRIPAAYAAVLDEYFR